VVSRRSVAALPLVRFPPGRGLGHNAGLAMADDGTRTEAERLLEQTIRDVTQRVVHLAPSERSLVWIWRSAERPDDSVFMQYGDATLLNSFRAILAYVVRGVWHRAYRQGLQDGRSERPSKEPPPSMLPPARMDASLPREQWLTQLLDAAFRSMPSDDARAAGKLAVDLISAGAGVDTIEQAVREIRDATEGDAAWAYFCAEVLMITDRLR
jgi:hypothetical protein